MRQVTVSAAAILAAALLDPLSSYAAAGYYRTPALRGDVLVFAAEGDLWRVPVAGGDAQRLTTAPGDETNPAISPRGDTLAFTASYEGPAEVYVMPLEGGTPRRLTFEGLNAKVQGFTSDGKILYGTTRYNGAPDEQVATVDPATGAVALLPLAQAHDGSYNDDGSTFYFTRLPEQSSHTKYYRGGTAQSIWKWTRGDSEAVDLTADFPGTSRSPMWWKGRVYFVSDRDSTMNLWSMDPDGKDLRQLTHHRGWDVLSPSLGDGRIAYQIGADLRIYDIASGTDVGVVIHLVSDLDQTREQWVKSPVDFVTAAHIAPDGKRVVLTAYGKVFVAPAGPGRLVEAGRNPGVRYREARFFPDGKRLLALSTQTGETEFVTLPPDGIGPGELLTHDADVLRWEGIPSPDGKWVAHHDKNQRLWLLDVARKTSRQIDQSDMDNFSGLVWSPDSRFLVYDKVSENGFKRLIMHDTRTGHATDLTTDRYDSYAAAFSPDGKFLYFLSDRVFESLVTSVWGSRQAEPYFDRSTRIYVIPMKKDERSPFAPPDELHPAAAKDEKAKDGGNKGRAGKEKEKAPTVVPDLDGIAGRLQELPVRRGNYDALAVDADRLYVLEHASGPDPKTALETIKIDPETKEPKEFLADVTSMEQSADRKKLLVRKKDDFYVFDAGEKAGDDLSKAKLDLSGWTFPILPRDEWRQMFEEAWRLERDYFYDRKGMNGVDWKVMWEKYRPLVDRVTTRGELSDLLGQMISELSALHMFVYGGDLRKTLDPIAGASLGARLVRDPAAGGERIEHIYRTDPDRPGDLSPLARPGVDVADGDVLTAVNGVDVLSVPDSGMLLRNQAGKQVLLTVKPAKGGAPRNVVVEPVSASRDAGLRYDEWEYTRRLEVERLSGGKIGYVHLRAMGPEDITQWYREFYPVFNKPGLIVDARYNRGGDIESFILEKLIRRAWAYWQPRVGRPTWDMQYAFRGHAIALCNYRTASDGELFSEGFRRLGIGKVLGVRTWGGEIWLSSDNFLVDHGIATAAEYGMYGPDRDWLIEGHGVDPDIVVDDLPRATFEGKDAQLEAAVVELLKEIAADPRPVPAPPPYPDKAR